MADTIQPVSKPVPKADGLANPANYSTLTTPQPSMGTYFGSGMKGKDSVSRHNIMGGVSKKSKE
jgi:hypothetical protein